MSRTPNDYERGKDHGYVSGERPTILDRFLPFDSDEYLNGQAAGAAIREIEENRNR